MCWLQTNQIQAICSTVKPRNGARISISAQVLKTRLGWNNHCRHWSSSCLIVSHGQICLRDAQYKPAYNHHVFAWPAWMVVRLLFLMLNDGWQAKTGRGEFSPHPECPWGEFSQKWPQKEWLNNVMKIPQIFPKENGSKWKMIPNRSRSMFDMWLPNQCLRWKTGTKGRCIPTDSDRSTTVGKRNAHLRRGYTPMPLATRPCAASTRPWQKRVRIRVKNVTKAGTLGFYHIFVEHGW